VEAVVKGRTKIEWGSDFWWKRGGNFQVLKGGDCETAMSHTLMGISQSLPFFPLSPSLTLCLPSSNIDFYIP
jgi:hypothetical protein